jgi:hypothetical protein
MGDLVGRNEKRARRPVFIDYLAELAEALAREDTGNRIMRSMG